MTAPQFYLACYQTLPAALPANLETLRVDGIPIDPRRTSLQFATQLPGGFGAFSAGYAHEFQLDDVDRRTAWLSGSVTSPALGHLVLRTGQGALLWEGRRSLGHYPGGRLRQIEGVGYGTDPLADPVLTAPPTLSTTSRNVLRWALSTVTPPYLIGDISQFQDPGVRHALEEYLNQTPAQVMDQLAKEGGGVNLPFDFTVYERRAAAFTSRTAPAATQYAVPFDATVDWSNDDRELYGAVIVTYTSVDTGTAETFTTTDPTFADRVGAMRTKLLPLGTLTTAAAEQYAKTWLALHSRPWVSVTVTRTVGRGVELAGGGSARPACYVRAGEWCSVGTEGPFIVVRTQYTAETQAFSMDLGQPAAGWASLLSDLRSVAGHVKRGTNPNSGAKAA